MHRAFTGRCWAAVCTLAVIAASGCLGGSGGASSVRPSTAREHIRVTSSLVDLKVAPAYVHWVADPSLKRQVSRVGHEFVVFDEVAMRDAWVGPRGRRSLVRLPGLA